MRMNRLSALYFTAAVLSLGAGNKADSQIYTHRFAHSQLPLLKDVAIGRPELKVNLKGLGSFYFRQANWVTVPCNTDPLPTNANNITMHCCPPAGQTGPCQTFTWHNPRIESPVAGDPDPVSGPVSCTILFGQTASGEVWIDPNCE